MSKVKDYVLLEIQRVPRFQGINGRGISIQDTRQVTEGIKGWRGFHTLPGRKGREHLSQVQEGKGNLGRRSDLGKYTDSEKTDE